MWAFADGSTNSVNGWSPMALPMAALRSAMNASSKSMSARDADVAVAAGEVVPLEVVHLLEVVLVEAEPLIARETPERRLVRVDQVRRVEDPLLLQQPRRVVVGVRRPLEAMQLHRQSVEVEAVARPVELLRRSRERSCSPGPSTARVFALAMISKSIPCRLAASTYLPMSPMWSAW